MYEPMLFMFALLITGCLLFVKIYFVITLSDLECDYLNAQQCCSKLNMWVLPKIIVQGILLFLLLFYFHWLLALSNLPVLIWLIYEYTTVPEGNLGVYDPTEIHNRGQLKKHMRNCMIYVGFHLIFFFVYMYCLINGLLVGDPTGRLTEEVHF